MPPADTPVLLRSCNARRGELIDVVVMDGRGFGFITFKDPDNATSFLSKRQHEIDEKPVEAKSAVPRSASDPPPSRDVSKKLFVGGTGDLEQEEFRTYFEQFGETEDAAVVKMPDGKLRGFGFVTFRDDDAMERCLAVRRHTIGGQAVEVKKAVPKGQDPSSMAGGRGASSGYGGGGGMSYGGYSGGMGYGGGYGGYSGMGAYGGMGGMGYGGMYSAYGMGGMGMYGAYNALAATYGAAAAGGYGSYGGGGGGGSGDSYGAVRGRGGGGGGGGSASASGVGMGSASASGMGMGSMGMGGSAGYGGSGTGRYRPY